MPETMEVKSLNAKESLEQLKAMPPEDRVRVMMGVAHDMTVQARIVQLSRMRAAEKVDALGAINEAIHILVQFRPSSEMFWYEEAVENFPEQIGLRLAEYATWAG